MPHRFGSFKLDSIAGGTFKAFRRLKMAMMATSERAEQAAYGLFRPRCARFTVLSLDRPLLSSGCIESLKTKAIDARVYSASAGRLK